MKRSRQNYLISAVFPLVLSFVVGMTANTVTDRLLCIVIGLLGSIALLLYFILAELSRAADE
jgi:hypothetical protein